MLKRFIFFLLAVLLLYSCSNNKHLHNYAASIIADTNKTTVIPYIANNFVEWLPKNATATTLTTEELINVEKILSQCIDSNYRANRKFSSGYLLSRYNRQYIPFINEKGEKLVWANCFCDGSNLFPDWKSKIADANRVSDGGECYINVTINLATQSFGTLHKNGYG